MTHLCPEWNQIKDLPTQDLTTFLRSHDDELSWYLQLIRQRESKHEKMVSDINVEIKKLTEIKNMLSDENEGLRDKTRHLEQELIFLHEIVDSLEKENAKLKN
ncbi:MAG: hypothetical protein HZB73_01715 [Nitrosarchaeum sp.]|nr:hypothetical protein [Nitrosarchaeum sp.]